MKKIVFVIITLAVLLLASCSGETGLPPITDMGTPVAAVPADTPDAPAVDLSGAARYAYLDTAGPEVPQASESELLAYADTACAGLSAGSPILTAQALDDLSPSLTDLQASAIVGAALGSGYCDHVWVP